MLKTKLLTQLLSYQALQKEFFIRFGVDQDLLLTK